MTPMTSMTSDDADHVDDADDADDVRRRRRGLARDSTATPGRRAAAMVGVMNEDWIARWHDGRIGFHEGRPNAFLERHIAELAACRRVFVPLCGRAEDVAFLAAHGHEVVGVELAEQ